MKKVTGRGARLYAAGLGILGLCILGAAAEDELPYETPAASETSAVQTPETVIRNWPERPRTAARALIEKYGAPNRFDENDLVWFKNGPWKKTVVYRSAPQGFMHSRDILEQSISYDVPAGKLAAIESFDSRLTFDKKSGELSSRAESENLNFLALNLADEVATDKRSPDEARDFYRKTVKLSESGKTSAYTGGFLFPLQEDNSSTQNPELNPNLEPKPAEPPHQSGIPETVAPAPSAGMGTPPPPNP
jgi:hypothetical protein